MFQNAQEYNDQNIFTMLKKTCLILFLSILSVHSYAQISYEKGYYIDNNNQKVDCFIKDMGWRNNPTEFKIKGSENGESSLKTMASVKEFGIHDVLKFVRRTVKMDRTSNDVNTLTLEKRAIFQEEELFLKVLVEGKSTLYTFVDSDVIRFFYSTQTSTIEQLIYKSYLTAEDKVGTNTRFKQQLWKDLKCDDIKSNRIQKLEYRNKDLVKLFVDYNSCSNQEYISYVKKKKGGQFNMNLRPRFNSSSMKFLNYYPNYSEADLPKEQSFGFGIEAEFILHFNKNKWSIIIEPTYQSYKAEQTVQLNNVVKTEIPLSVAYKSIELPIGVRHYFFLNQNSKVFINASFIVDLYLNGSQINEYAIESEQNFAFFNMAFGVGYKYNDKYSIELRHQTPRTLYTENVYWNLEYQTFSAVLGYTLF